MEQAKKLDRKVIRCKKCPRLIDHCKNIAKEKRRAYMDWKYWGKPVANFGDPRARLLVLGLAPAAHGANRTGRMFTGDRSGDWLYRALFRAGFANQAESVSVDDGLVLNDALISAVAHCAPPDNKPLKEEVAACKPYLVETFEITPVKVILALGGIAWKAALDHAVSEGWWSSKRPIFGHAASVQLDNGMYLVGSYHPSQQNTFTGRLTEKMLDQVFQKIRKLIQD